jgi:hypothetical protein
MASSHSVTRACQVYICYHLSLCPSSIFCVLSAGVGALFCLFLTVPSVFSGHAVSTPIQIFCFGCGVLAPIVGSALAILLPNRYGNVFLAGLLVSSSVSMFNLLWNKTEKSHGIAGRDYNAGTSNIAGFAAATTAAKRSPSVPSAAASTPTHASARDARTTPKHALPGSKG